MIGNSRDGTYSKKGTYQGQGAYFFPETAECAKQSFDASLENRLVALGSFLTRTIKF